MRVTDSKTPRNLCARAWKQQQPNGLIDAYEKYWNELNDADRKIWTDKSAKLHKGNDASANCRYCIRGIGGEQVTLATGTDEAERGRQMSAEGSRECTM